MEKTTVKVDEIIVGIILGVEHWSITFSTQLARVEIDNREGWDIFEIGFKEKT